MKRIFIGQLILLLSISSLLYANDFPTYTIDQSKIKPEIVDRVIEIKPTKERNHKTINLNNFRPQNPDEVFKCDDINSSNLHYEPVCAHRVEKVKSFRGPCQQSWKWISYPSPQKACTSSNITEYALGKCIYMETDPNLDIFIEKARCAVCSDRNNRLFLIDNNLVFWHVEGKCPDGSYGLILYDKSSHQILCSLRDSIAGPMRTIKDSKYEFLFDIIIQNIEDPNLGLSSDYKVEEIPFSD